MSYSQILFEKRGAVGLITLNRPDRLNAWTYQMRDELVEAINDCNDDSDIGAMVMTGAGRGFCAGADIKDTFSTRIEGGSSQGSVPAVDWVRLVRSSKPLIAAVNGPCIGLGATMILSFDVILASDLARFAMAFVKMGVLPELASSHFLALRVGFGRASEMCLTGRIYEAQEVHRMGLVDHLVGHDELVPRSIALAEEIAANPAQQLRWVKELLTLNASESDLALVQKREGERLALAYQSPEHREAVQAFIEKRAPDFRAAAKLSTVE
ncbi:MAG: enoyl-CoA hydratase-related protein [Pseudomonadales bacterium]